MPRSAVSGLGCRNVGTVITVDPLASRAVEFISCLLD
jgi:hypothetical protein